MKLFGFRRKFKDKVRALGIAAVCLFIIIGGYVALTKPASPPTSSKNPVLD